VLEIDDVSVELGLRTVLSHVSAFVPAGSWLGVVGSNGAGKSTLIRAIAGLVAHSGHVRVAGHEYSAHEHRARALSVAYVPQRPVMPPAMPVADYVLLGRAAHHSYLGSETGRDRRVAAAVIERLDLASLRNRRLGELSGGEAQRAVLARALAQEAPVLIMDEPTTSLDLGHSQMVLELADELRREQGLCVLCALHDLTLAAQFSSELLVLYQGSSVAAGAPADVLSAEAVLAYFGAEVEVLPGLHGPVIAPLRRRGHPVEPDCPGTLPASTSPASTSPASTAPASTSPASTSPASTAFPDTYRQEAAAP